MSSRYTIELFRNRMLDKIRPMDGILSSYIINVLFSGELHYILDGKEVTLKGSDAIFMPPHCHRIRLADNTPAHFCIIKFKINDDSVPELPTVLPDCVTEELKELLFLGEKIIKDRSGKHSEEKLNHILELILISLEESREKESDNPHIRKILQYIQNHFTEKITLQEIADHTFLSVPYCCNLVKKELGTTVNKLILKERVLLAQEYILQGDTPLRDIPYLCGFNDYCHFSKCFKEFTGCPPSRYKSGSPLP